MAIYKGMNKEEFIEWFENRVKSVIDEYNLINDGEKIVVAVSGGKDSLTILYLLNKFGYDVDALVIDEGIKDYREHTISDLKKFVEEYKINLKIVRAKDETGYNLDEITKKLNLIPCTPCGIIRRHLLNKYALGYDKIATGHNLDDEVQSFVMNLFKNNWSLIARQGPITGTQRLEGFTQRIKPLIKVNEKEVRIYAFLKGFQLHFSECPYAHQSFRNYVRDWLNELEIKNPGTKERLLDNMLRILPTIKEKYKVKDTSTIKDISYDKLIRTLKLISKK